VVQTGVSEVWGDAWDVYKLLFRRSVRTAAIVFAVIEGLDPLDGAIDQRGAHIAFAVLSFVLGLAGPVLVQGALVEIVRNIHEGRRPDSIRELLAGAGRRIHSLFWASLVYGFGVFFGLLLLIVPGLLAASRWCLMAPLIMLEDETAGDAPLASSHLVRPYTWPVLGTVVVTFIVTSIVNTAIPLGIGFRDVGPFANWLIVVIASSLTAPFSAHVLTVIYYRITDPENRVIHPDVRTWRSVWEAA
jgi:hypothetical protein